MLRTLLSRGNALSKRGLSEHSGSARLIRRKRVSKHLDNIKNMFPAPGADIDFDFLNDQVYIFGRGINKCSDLLKPYFTRGSSATYIDIVNGQKQLSVAGNNEIRLPYDLTLRGTTLVIEGGTTNYLRNNTMQGANPATNTAPTYWDNTTSISGLTRQIVGTGVESGIEYVDIRWSGTTSAPISAATLVRPETITAVGAAAGQTWCGSSFVKLAGGSLSGVTLLFYVVERSLAGNFITSSSGTFVPTTQGLINQRVYLSRTFTDATTEKVSLQLAMTIGSGVAVDFTLRIGLPQLEKGFTYPTTPVKTYGTSLSRASDLFIIPFSDFPDLFKANQGTFITKAKCSDSASTRNIMSISDGTSANKATLRMSNSNTASYVLISNNGSIVSNPGAIAISPINTLQTLSMSYSDNFCMLGRENIFKKSVANTFSFPSLSMLRLGSDGDGVGNLNGVIQRLVYYPECYDDDVLRGVLL